MSPDMDYLDQLRLARCWVQSQKDVTETEFDTDCLLVIQDLLEKTISQIEFIRRF